jgi:tetratricopeptide (TPR) repeat protein
MPATEARNYLEQASALSKLGQYQQAIPLYESALATFERIYGGDQPELAECLQELGDAYEAAYRLSDALRIHTRLLRLGERILGKANPNIVAMLFKLAQLNEMLGRPYDALDFCSQALTSARMSLPQDDPLSQQIANSHRYLTTLAEAQTPQKRQIWCRTGKRKYRWTKLPIQAKQRHG